MVLRGRYLWSNMFMTIKNVDVSGDLVLKRDETYSVMRPRLENIQMRMGLIRRHFSFDFYHQVRGVAEVNGLLNSVFWTVIGKIAKPALQWLIGTLNSVLDVPMTFNLPVHDKVPIMQFNVLEENTQTDLAHGVVKSSFTWCCLYPWQPSTKHNW